MKKLISLFITTAMLFAGIQAFAVSDSDVMQYMNTQSEEYVKLLGNNTEFLNTVVVDKILPIYNFKDGNLFASYNDLNFASYFYDEALYYIALDKNGEKIKMDTAAIIRDDRTYIPLRFIGEAFGYDVEWIR